MILLLALPLKTTSMKNTQAELDRGVDHLTLDNTHNTHTNTNYFDRTADLIRLLGPVSFEVIYKERTVFMESFRLRCSNTRKVFENSSEL